MSMTQRNGLIPIAPETPNRRALILSGGGMRVAYQAGVVKALYDAGLRFSYADGTSAGIMNLSALLGGLTPEQLCARWRTLKPKYFLSPRSLRAYTKFPFTGAFGDFDNIEKRVFPHLGVDAERVRQSQGTRSTFNVCDFTDKVVVPVAHTDIAHEQLLAAISLPLATPPVRYQERFWTDAVWIKNANLLETVKAGSNELWVVWYIGNTPTFSDGLLEQYVHMIEMASVGSLNEELAAIADINARIERGERPYGHEQPIKVHIIHPANPIPLDPDFLKGKIDGATLVAYGYRDASRYFTRGHQNARSGRRRILSRSHERTFDVRRDRSEKRRAPSGGDSGCHARCGGYCRYRAIRCGSAAQLQLERFFGNPSSRRMASCHLGRSLFVLTFA
jgi:predicted acylesterase/phospholipase RssA